LYRFAIHQTIHRVEIIPAGLVAMIGALHESYVRIIQIKDVGQKNLVSTMRRFVSDRESLIKGMKNYLYGMNIGILVIVFLMNIENILPSSFGHYIKNEENDHDWSVVAMGLTAVIAVLLHNYAEKRALAEHHKQYKRMKTVFQRAKNALPDLIRNEDMANARALLGIWAKRHWPNTATG